MYKYKTYVNVIHEHMNIEGYFENDKDAEKFVKSFAWIKGLVVSENPFYDEHASIAENCVKRHIYGFSEKMLPPHFTDGDGWRIAERDDVFA